MNGEKYVELFCIGFFFSIFCLKLHIEACGFSYHYFSNKKFTPSENTSHHYIFYPARKYFTELILNFILAGSQQAPSRRFRFSVRSTGAPENHHPPGREVPSEVFQVLRSLYPGGEIHVEDLASQGTAAGPVTENAGTTSSAAGTMDQQEPERRVTEEGIFLSNLLREIMPVVSQFAGATPDVSTQPPNASEQRTAHQSSTQVSLFHLLFDHS